MAARADARGDAPPDGASLSELVERVTGHDLDAVIDRRAEAARLRHAPPASRMAAGGADGLRAALDDLRFLRAMAVCDGLGDAPARHMRRRDDPAD